MIAPQQLVIRWLETAAAATILLVAAKIVLSRLRQPADRINLILIVFVLTAVVPLLMCLAPVPAWHLGLVQADRSLPETPRPIAPLMLLPEVSHQAPSPAPGSAQVQETLGIEFSLASPEPHVATVPISQRFDPWWLAAIVLIATHAIAAGLFLIEWLVSVRWLRKIAARGCPASKAVQDAWIAITEGRGGWIRLRISDRISVPLVYGCVRPTILIPESIASGEMRALRFCLLHEWTHIANGDLRSWRLTWFCQFLLWYQPLFWSLRRELRLCQDLLADDRATAAGTDRVEYSELLMTFARQQIARPVVGTIAFIDRSSPLSRRINMLLSPSAALRARSPRSFWLVAGTLSLVSSLLLGTMRLDSVGAEDDRQAASSSNARQTDGSSSEKPGKEKNGATNSETKSVRGRVIDEGGAPVRGARLWLALSYRPRRVVQGTTDLSGRFELKFPAAWVRPEITGSGWTIWAYADAHSIAAVSAFKEIREQREKEVEIKLPFEGNRHFKVLTPEGNPLAGALVQPQNYRTTVGYELVPEEMHEVVSARTDADGVAVLKGVQSEPLFRISVVHEKFGNQSFRVDGNPADPQRAIRLRETGKIEGHFVAEREEWLRGIRLIFTTDNQDEWSDGQGWAQTVTDEAGRFEVPAIASGGPLHTWIEFDPSLPVRPRLNDDEQYLAGGETLRIEIPMVPAPKVRGKLQVKSTGKPVAKAEIALSYGNSWQSDHAITDENGHFEGRALPGPVQVQIIVMPSGYVQLGRTWEQSYEVPGDVDEFELPAIEVVETHELTGELVDDQDQPISGMQIQAVHEGRRYDSVKTDEKGRFTMTVPRDVTPSMVAYSDEWGPEPLTVIKRDPLVLLYARDTFELDLAKERESKPSVALTGRVLSEGIPLARVPLTLNRGVPVPNPDGSKSISMRMKEIAITETDADGRYRLTGLKAGDSYQITVKPPFEAVDPSWRHQLPYIPKLLDSAPGEVALPDINLSKLTQSLSGRIVDPAGNPVAGAQVSALLRDRHTSIPRLSDTAPPPWTKTDEQGRFKLQQLPNESLTIMAYIPPKEGSRIRFPAKINVELNQQDIRIVLDPSLVDKR